jgi:hypothetical protein
MSVYDDYVEKLAQSEKAGQEAINLSTKQQAENIDLMRQRAVKERENAMRGAYTDYRNVTNPYGYSSESAFGRGLSGSGKGESYQANVYNAYQNALNSARSDYNTRAGDLDMALNNVYTQAAMDRLGLTQDRYANEGSALWTNADLERALAADAEAKRQFELNLAWQKEQAAIANDQWERQFALQQRAASSGGSRSSGSSSSSQNDTFDYLVGLFDQNNPYNNYNSYIGSGANTNPVYNTKNWMAQTLSDNAGSLTPEQYRALVTTYGLSEYI